VRPHSLPLTRLIHENLSVVMCFAYSRKPLEEMIEREFIGHPKYLSKAIFDISEERAEKAWLELALFLRTLDDAEEISAYIKRTKSEFDCGRCAMKDGSEIALSFREVANKVIHASHRG
jgi:hypothetical protein